MSGERDNTIAGQITRALAERIVAGDIEPGARLRQDHIAQEFGASHVPVREAFRRLEAQGLAISEPRRGVRVASFDLSSVREVAEMRAALESLALRHAAPRLTPAILDAAEQATLAGDRSRDVRSWEEANRTFHRTIVTPCNMPRLLAAIDDLHAMSARFLFATWRSDWETRTDHDHRAILAALRAGQIDNAVSILARHVQWIGQRPVRLASGATREAFSIQG
ncbi:GntR family transcriptional regulator [Paradevosia shaoguanensis]|uniref:GntR family transcriptional regulator n=1 Tax=Paradevosia shaoguanensis TaxID=1335043 RepID=A0AA41UDV9_9HYPH|nr:GntR family transcriptional regulator [Paradevosia shaoguanensis]KFL27475.1 GntR family transcriptional regulator [Devosia sp. 17-2-E-8]MCF1743301.1 GntR family transcriptional regulator [Paradevosia shaoguanensis]MCI0127784.1 GntR family transcriptional regulator [Paradevosia shaoguanensis]QMV01368.1 FCD domain-containing protein [Devosia sp. D6-9]